MPGAAICLTVFSVYFAIEYGVAVNASWLIVCIFISTLLAIALPPLPGSGLMIFSTCMLSRESRQKPFCLQL